MGKKINQYNFPYNEMAIYCQKLQGNKPDGNLTLDHKKDEGGFDWKETLEGYDFWRAVSNDLEPKLTFEIMSNYPSDLFTESNNEKIWCLKDNVWFETILITKLPENVKTPYCVVSEDNVTDYLNNEPNIKVELYESLNVSLENPNYLTNEYEITIEQGIKILEEHGYKVIK